MIRLATPNDAAAVHAIYAPIVRKTPISFELEAPTVAEIRRRIKKVLTDRPWLVWVQDSEVMGYVYASTFRDRPAYRWTTEVSVYIAEPGRGQGLGRALYRALFRVLRLQGYCTVVAGATVPNPASETLHKRMGFQPAGLIKAAGYKFGRWHDVAFFTLPLCEMPKRPREPLPVSVLSPKKLSDAIKTDYRA